MSNPLVNDEDLDDEFVPDPDMLGDQGNGSGIQIVTKVKPAIQIEHKATPSIKQLIATKLVEVKNNVSKITNLRDVHDAIVAAESVSKSDAESIQLATESFLSPRLNLNGFTDIRSSVNFKETSLYLNKKINELQTATKVLTSSIATESVVEYAATIASRDPGARNVVAINDNIEKSMKGIFILKDKKMVNISKEGINKLEEFLTGSDISSEMKMALVGLFNAANTETVLKFIQVRMAGVSLDDAVNILRVKKDTGDQEDNAESIFTVSEYLNKYLTEDIEEIHCRYHNNKSTLEFTVDQVRNASEDTEEFVNVVSSAMIHFSNTEILEELLFKIPLLVAVINKIIIAAKF